ncbi:MAG: hypothetical protein ACRCVG_01710 [Methanobacteriaceae archaeon]
MDNNTNNNNNANTTKNYGNNIILEIKTKINDILDVYNDNMGIIDIVGDIDNNIDNKNNISEISNNCNISNYSDKNRDKTSNKNSSISSISSDNKYNNNNNNSSNDNSCDIGLDSSKITKAFEINEIKEFSFLNTSYCRGNIRLYNINSNQNLKEVLSNVEKDLTFIFSHYGAFEVKSEYYCPCCILPYYRIKFSIDISNF